MLSILTTSYLAEVLIATLIASTIQLVISFSTGTQNDAEAIIMRLDCVATAVNIKRISLVSSLPAILILDDSDDDQQTD